MDEFVVGKALMDESCENLHVVNELNIPVVCVGIQNAVISASAEGIWYLIKKKPTI